MTSTSIADVISALTAAEEALHRVPQLERDLADARSDRETYARETELIRDQLAAAQAEIETLKAKVRSVEVERDEVAFRELQAQDTLAQVASRFDNLHKLAGEIDRLAAAHAAEAAPQPAPAVDPEPIRPTPETDGASTSQPSPSQTANHADTTEPVGQRGTRKFEGWPYWDRPDGVSVEDFLSEGGEKSPWDR